MHLTCPSCDTTFAVDPDQIGAAGRRVRCGSCGHDWFQEAPGADSTAEEAPPPEAPAPEAPAPEVPAPEVPAPAAAPARRERPRRPPPRHKPAPRGRGVMFGWLLLLIVALGLAAGAYFGRERIVSAFPAAAELYEMIGLAVIPPLGEGLEFREVKTARRTVDGESVVVVEGLVVNVSNAPRAVPRMRASLMDSAGKTVEQWTFDAAQTNLPPGAETRFETTTGNVPKNGNLSIDFVAAR